MDFKLNKPQLQIQKAVRDFVKGEFKKEVIDELLENHAFPVDIWRKAGDLGLIGIHFPEQYSGQGLGVFEATLIAEELCRGDASAGGCIVGSGYGADLILRYGSDEQKETWLPKVAEGGILSCGAFTEPGLGNDLSRVETIAEKDCGEWVINGTKTFVLNGGHYSGFYIVLCKTGTGPAASPSDRKLSTILVPADGDGITVGDIGKRIGGDLMSMATVSFDQVRVPEANLIGKENQGLAHLMGFLDENRIVAAAQSTGIAQGAFERSFRHVKDRVQFGRRIADFQITRQKLADMSTQIEAARLLTYQAAWLSDQGRSSTKINTMAQLQASTTAVEVCDEAIQLLGGYGYIQEFEVERFYREARTADIFNGSRITRRNVIAGELLKGKRL
ncbi:MAG: acyl-CoA dehydrogenase [Desulfobacteraceae bacterium]|nr:acyl-CoA dehydrogenase [Desulfobacteraceae bacterium]